MKHTIRLLVIGGVVLGLMIAPAAAGTKSGKTAWMGVYTQTVDKELAETFDLPVQSGVIINEVLHDSPAEEAGLQEDDIVISLDGNKIADAVDLTDMVRAKNPGDQITLKIIRDGKEKELAVTLGTTKKFNLDRTYSRFSPEKYFGNALTMFKKHGYIGVSLQSLSGQLGEYFGVPEGNGALIGEVEKDSPAEKAGLKAGDVIVAIGDEKIENPSDVSDIIAAMKEGETADIKIIRDRKDQTLAVEIGKTDAPDWYGKIDPRTMDLSPYLQGLPKMKGLHFGQDSKSDSYFDAGEYQQQMQALQEQMKQLQDELKELKKKLD